MTLALALVEQTDIALPPIKSAIAKLAELHVVGDSETLTQAHISLEAQELYERRSEAVERELYFGTLRAVSEGMIGSLSYDDSSIIESRDRLRNWRCIATLWERGLLERMIETHGRCDVAYLLRVARNIGATSVRPQELRGVPFNTSTSIPWHKARKICRAHGIDPTTLPLDKTAVRLRAAIQRSRQTESALHRQWARDNRERVLRNNTSRLAREKSDDLGNAYAGLRKMQQIVHRLSTKAPSEDCDRRVARIYGLSVEIEKEINILIREWRTT